MRKNARATRIALRTVLGEVGGDVSALLEQLADTIDEIGYEITQEADMGMGGEAERGRLLRHASDIGNLGVLVRGYSADAKKKFRSLRGRVPRR
jgi:hypothetical protein